MWNVEGVAYALVKQSFVIGRKYIKTGLDKPVVVGENPPGIQARRFFAHAFIEELHFVFSWFDEWWSLKGARDEGGQ